MRAADRAYYGVYTPSCPIQPDSLRNRLYGAASWSSRLRADGLITYDGGLGEQNINAMEFAHLLEVLAKEMQPVLDTLVKATVADQAEAPNTWRFEIREHARSLREARSHIDLSCVHIRATTECGKAVRFYRKYRKQAEDLLHVTPQPEPAQQTTELSASDTSMVKCHPSHAAHERPLVTPDPSIHAEAQPSPSVQAGQASDAPSEPPLGLPAEGEEVGHGSPALVPPRKDVMGLAGEESSSAGSRASLATDQQARDLVQSGRASEATRQGLRAQTTPSEVALPESRDTPAARTRTRSAPPAISDGPSSAEFVVSARGERGDRHAPWSELLRMASSRTQGQQHHFPPSGPAPALEPNERECQQSTPIWYSKDGGHLLEDVRQLWTMGSTTAGESGRPRCVPIRTSAQVIFARNAPSQSSSPPPPSASHDRPAARTWTCPAPLGKPASTELDVSVQEERQARHVPWSKTPLTAGSQQWHLSPRGPAPTSGLVKEVQKPRQVAEISTPPARIRPAARACTRTAIPDFVRESPSTKLEVSARDKCEAQPAPRSEPSHIGNSRARRRSRHHDTASVPVSAVAHAQTAQAIALVAARPSTKTGGRPKNTELGSSKVGGVSTSEIERPRNVPAPRRSLSLSPPARILRNMPDVRAHSCTARQVLACDLGSPELDIRARIGSSAKHTPGSHPPQTAISRAQVGSHGFTFAAPSRDAPASALRMGGLPGGERTRRGVLFPPFSFSQPLRRSGDHSVSAPARLVSDPRGANEPPQSVPT
ncbi:hypothetical protein EV715DRAFT_278357 [Schizophyllum commune]